MGEARYFPRHLFQPEESGNAIILPLRPVGMVCPDCGAVAPFTFEARGWPKMVSGYCPGCQPAHDAAEAEAFFQ